MTIYKFSVQQKNIDPRNESYKRGAHALGFHQLQRMECQDLYFIEGQLSQEELQQLALKLLSDPVTQTVIWDELPAPHTPPEADSVILEVSLRPGVTDPVAAEIVRAAHEIGLNGVHRAATGQRFILTGLEESQIPLLVNQLLANNVIQHWKLGSIEPSFPEEVESSGQVETIAIRNLSDDELLALSKDRRAALDWAEMQAIRAYCQKENRDLTDVEFETIAQTWSEHCVHKTFKAKV
ncbi:MAG: phosphoribosylformylglycinamidine synthase subunit PurS, partial [Chloroflexota bacterium]